MFHHKWQHFIAEPFLKWISHVNISPWRRVIRIIFSTLGFRKLWYFAKASWVSGIFRKHFANVITLSSASEALCPAWVEQVQNHPYLTNWFFIPNRKRLKIIQGQFDYPSFIFMFVWKQVGILLQFSFISEFSQISLNSLIWSWWLLNKLQR